MATDRTSIHAALDDLIDQGVDPTEVTGAIARSLSYQRERDVEPLLQDSRRYVLLPIQYPDIWEIYKRAVSAFWTVDEIDLKSDVDDWEHRLTENERTFIKNILAFFAASDFIVNENLMDRFMNEVKVPEAQCFYAFQAAVESIHCVAPETVILTTGGYQQIQSLQDMEIHVWNGQEFSNVTVRKTSDASKLVKVVLSNGMKLECTEEHKWIVRTGNRKHPEQCKVERVTTTELTKGTVIAKYALPTTDPKDPDEFLNPYTHGVFCGDGSHANGYPFLRLYGEKQKLLPFLKVSTARSEAHLDRTACYLTGCVNKAKFYVPTNYSMDTKLRWLEGIADTDGCAARSKSGNTSIQIGSVEKHFLLDVQLMLTTMGVISNIRLQQGAHKQLLSDGRGGHRLFSCQPQWIMYITGSSVQHLRQLGFSPKRLQLSTTMVKANPMLITVVDVIDEGRISPTYCFSEPLRHMGVFNGILTGQSESYSLLLDTFIRDPVEKRHALNAVETIPCIKKKAGWAQKWIADRDSTFAKRLVCFAIVEGVMFSGSFCALYWLRKRNLMKGLTFSNSLIARDEGLHTEHACILYSHVVNKLTDEEIHRIMEEAVAIETEFICSSIPCAMLGMNSKQMSEFIRFVADRLLLQLGHPKLYGARNPFDFMDLSAVYSKSSFFEQRPSEYQRANIGLQASDMEFGTDADF